jgi:hypothetical protein
MSTITGDAMMFIQTQDGLEAELGERIRRLRKTR